MSFEDTNGGESDKRYYLPTVEIEDYNVIIDGKTLFDQPIQNNVNANNNIIKKPTGQCHD